MPDYMDHDETPLIGATSELEQAASVEEDESDLEQEQAAGFSARRDVFASLSRSRSEPNLSELVDRIAALNDVGVPGQPGVFRPRSSSLSGDASAVARDGQVDVGQSFALQTPKGDIADTLPREPSPDLVRGERPAPPLPPRGEHRAPPLPPRGEHVAPPLPPRGERLAPPLPPRGVDVGPPGRSDRVMPPLPPFPPRVAGVAPPLPPKLPAAHQIHQAADPHPSEMPSAPETTFDPDTYAKSLLLRDETGEFFEPVSNQYALMRAVSLEAPGPRGDLARSLSVDQYVALGLYTNGNYGRLNKALRADGDLPDHTQALVDGITAALANAPDSAVVTESVYRGATLPAEMIDQMLATGLYSEPAFLSASRDKSVAEKFARDRGDGNIPVVFELAGCPVDLGSLSIEGDEQEALFNRGSTFKVEEIVRDGAGYRVKAEQITQADANGGP